MVCRFESGNGHHFFLGCRRNVYFSSICKSYIANVLAVSFIEDQLIPVKLGDDCHVYKIDDLSYAVPIVNGDVTAVDCKHFVELPEDTEEFIFGMVAFALDMSIVAKACISFGRNCSIGTFSNLVYTCDHTVRFPFAEFTYVNQNLVLINLSDKIKDDMYLGKLIEFMKEIMTTDDFKTNEYVKDLI